MQGFPKLQIQTLGPEILDESLNQDDVDDGDPCLAGIVEQGLAVTYYLFAIFRRARHSGNAGVQVSPMHVYSYDGGGFRVDLHPAI